MHGKFGCGINGWSVNFICMKYVNISGLMPPIHSSPTENGNCKYLREVEYIIYYLLADIIYYLLLSIAFVNLLVFVFLALQL